jgi:hypothetical protein
MLKSVAEGVWVLESEVHVPAGYMPVQMTVVRGDGGALLLHSPVPLDDAAAMELGKLGEVEAIVAPSCFHYLFLREASARYPGARVYGPASLEKKLSGVAFEPLPASGAIAALGGALEVLRIDGAPALNEHVFLHRPSRTLLVTDLIFNVHRCRSPALRALLWLGRTWKRPAQSLAWRFLGKDRALLARSFAGVLAWEFDRVVPAHGDAIVKDARERLRQALKWAIPEPRFALLPH